MISVSYHQGSTKPPKHDKQHTKSKHQQNRTTKHTHHTSTPKCETQKTTHNNLTNINAQSNKLNIKRFQENDNWSKLILEMLGFETGEEYDKM